MTSVPHEKVVIEDCSSGSPVSLSLHHQEQSDNYCLFQHGLGADHRQCLEVFPHSSQYGFACVDCRAHGTSDYADPARMNLAVFANDLIQVIEQQLKPPVVIGGISMGAALSLRIAATRPDLVRALILARPAWAFDSAPDNMQPNLLVGELLSRYPPEQARQVFSATQTCKELERNAPDNLASLLSFFDRPDARDFAQVLCAVSNDGPGITREATENWQIPTLVLATPDDHVHPIALAEQLAERLNAGAIVTLPAKHNNKTRYVQAFRQHLTDFLDTVSS